MALEWLRDIVVLIPSVPAALVMHGLVEVGRIGLAAIQPTSTNHKTLFATVNLSLMHFNQENQFQ
jgi:hypothetical protein